MAINNAVKLMMINKKAKSISKSSLYYDSETGSVVNSAGTFMKKYLKINTDCGTETGECFAASYKNLSGDAVNLPGDGDAYCGIISTGASICITPPGYSGDSGEVLVDVNGPAKPNIAGRDLFLFYIYLDGFIGDRVSSVDSVEVCRANVYGSGCFNRIINADWTMDY